MRSLLYFVAIAGITLSCTVEESTRFNKDFSGTSTTQVDLSSVISFISSMDSAGAGQSKMYRDIQKSLDSASNANDMKKYNLSLKFDTVKNVVQVAYTFKNLDEVNNLSKGLAEKQQPGMTTKSSYRWEKKDKVLIMPGMEDMTAALGDQSSNPMMQGMSIAINRTFPKSIVKVSDSRFVISKDKKTLSFKATMEELRNNPMKEVTVTFK
jgi:hypothetical protein